MHAACRQPEVLLTNITSDQSQTQLLKAYATACLSSAIIVSNEIIWHVRPVPILADKDRGPVYI